MRRKQIAVRWLSVALLVMVVVAALPLQHASRAEARADYAWCAVNMNGMWSDRFSATFEECADAVGAYVARVQSLAYGAWGDYLLLAELDGDVFWASWPQGNRDSLTGGYYTIQLELQADCFAGSYAGYAATASELVILEPGDVEEGAMSVYLKGDDLPWFDPAAHGSPRQRHRAFMTGYQYGVSACTLD